MSIIPTSECLLGTGWHLMTLLPYVRSKALAVNFCGSNMSNGLPSIVTASASLMCPFLPGASTGAQSAGFCARSARTRSATSTSCF